VNDHRRILVIQAWRLSRAKTCSSPPIWRFALAGLLWVFADQSAENLPALDPGSDINSRAGLPRRFQLQASVRPMPVLARVASSNSSTSQPNTAP
jgi:hypothetical protein